MVGGIRILEHPLEPAGARLRIVLHAVPRDVDLRGAGHEGLGLAAVQRRGSVQPHAEHAGGGEVGEVADLPSQPVYS